MMKTDHPLVDFDVEIEDCQFRPFKNTLKKFELDIDANKIKWFLEIVSNDFRENLTVREKHVIAFLIREIITVAFEGVANYE